jgi:CxxC motif-containing protein (DUF1111 family)
VKNVILSKTLHHKKTKVAQLKAVCASFLSGRHNCLWFTGETRALDYFFSIVCSVTVFSSSDLFQGSSDVTAFDDSSEAYTNPVGGLTYQEHEQFQRGDEGFEAVFGLESNQLAGLGPRFNNVSCESCHIGDGRGLPIFGDPEKFTQGILKVSSPDGNPHPEIGSQFHDYALAGERPHGRIEVMWEEQTGSYADGSSYSLRRPITNITLSSSQPLQNILTSLRIAPPVFGTGLLEAISDEDILDWADPNDSNGDGIRGRPNWLPSKDGSVRLGRFGLKANNPSLIQQNAAAFAADMGVGSPVEADHTGNTTDISLEFLEDVTAYTQMLAVPARRNIYSEVVQRGQQAFMAMNCQSCHRSSFTTDDTHAVHALRNKTIYPFTDLLLHDMGPGLADSRPEFSASGQDWRTPPLWGIGLVRTVLGDEAYLHDGRARTLEEAILWHGGEAEKSKEAFRNAPNSVRNELIAFLKSL